MTGFIGEKLQQIIDEGGAGGGGGGLPLYRHTIEVYEASNDTYDIFIQLVSTSNEEVDTEDKLKAILGNGDCPCICTGIFSYNAKQVNASVIMLHGDGKYYIHDDGVISGMYVELFSTDYDLSFSYTVTAIDNASAAVTTLYRHDVLLYESGGDNFEVALSILSADETAYDTLDKVKNAVGIDKPMMVSGSVMYNGNATPACYVNFGTSAMNFWFDVDVERQHSYTSIVVEVTDTVRPLASITVNGSGGIDFSEIDYIDTYYGSQSDLESSSIGISWGQEGAIVDKQGNNVWQGYISHKVPLVAGYGVVFETDDDTVKIIATGTPKLYAPTIKISGLTLTIKNPTKNKDYVASYDIYNVDTNTLIRNTKNTTVDLESFNIADGTYNIAVKAKGIEFNRTPLYGESDYSNVLSYTHDNPPTLASGTHWYRATVDKSTITEITFDNTYEVTGNETESWDASSSQNGSVMCYLNGTSITIKPIHTTNKVHSNTSCHNMFQNFTSLTTINGLTALDTSSATIMQGMFLVCRSLISLDTSNFDTSKVSTMSYMFSNCNALTTLDVSGFDTSRVSDMSYMFANCFALTTLDVSNFDTSKVSNMFCMFMESKALTALDVSNFDTSNVTKMGNMFRNCNVLTADCSSWDVDNVTTHSNFNANAPNVIPPVWVN